MRPQFAGLPRPPASSTGLRIGGLTPWTSLDFPGELAAVIFCQGCPWRCRYCHNDHLLAPFSRHAVPWDDIETFLARRRGLLDAVVFSGGEPTLQGRLPHAVERVKSLGFKVGLHTAGCYPRRLQRLLPMLDWVGLDIKALPGDYPHITGVAGSGGRAWSSLAVLRNWGIPLEVRTTLVPGWSLPKQQRRLMHRLAERGILNYVIQPPRFGRIPAPPSTEGAKPNGIEALERLGNRLFPRFAIRRAPSD